MRVLRAFGRFISALVTWWTVVAALGVGLGLGAWHFIGHAPWYSQALLALAPFVAVVILLRDRRRIVGRAWRSWEAMRRPPMTDEHMEHLRRLARRTLSQIANNQNVHFGDIRYETSFREHFPALIQPLDGWTASLVAEAGAKTTAVGFVRDLAGQLHARDQLVMPHQIVRQVANCLEATLTSRTSDTPDPPIYLKVEDDPNAYLMGVIWMDPRPAGVPPEQAGSYTSSLVASLDGLEPSRDTERMQSIYDLMDQFKQSAEFKQAKDDRDARKQAQETLSEALRPVLENSRLFGFCEYCRSSIHSPLYEAVG